MPDMVHYDSSIPKNYSTNYRTLDFYYDNTNFDRLSKVTEQNLMSASGIIKKEIEDWIRKKSGLSEKKESVVHKKSKHHKKSVFSHFTSRL